MRRCTFYGSNNIYINASVLDDESSFRWSGAGPYCPYCISPCHISELPTQTPFSEIVESRPSRTGFSPPEPPGGLSTRTGRLWGHRS